MSKKKPWQKFAMKSKAAKYSKKRGQPRRDVFDHTKPLPKVKVPQTVLDKIMEKRDLLVSTEITEHVVLRYLRKHDELLAELDKPHFLRTAGFEAMQKWVRQELRVLVGMFVLETNLEKLLDGRTVDILKSHRSTAERLEHYPGLYDALFDGKNPRVILDLCSGLNPCSYEYLGCTPEYIAVDVSPQLMDFVQAWFTRKGIKGRAFAADVTRLNDIPPADTVFIFKGTDVLERVRYGYGEALLDKLKGRRVIVSFATATIGGGREIAVKKRSWVERWAESKNVSVRVHDIPGERFYVLE